jgi:hypothetical protein
MEPPQAQDSQSPRSMSSIYEITEHDSIMRRCSYWEARIICLTKRLFQTIWMKRPSRSTLRECMQSIFFCPETKSSTWWRSRSKVSPLKPNNANRPFACFDGLKNQMKIMDVARLAEEIINDVVLVRPAWRFQALLMAMVMDAERTLLALTTDAAVYSNNSCDGYYSTVVFQESRVWCKKKHIIFLSCLLRGRWTMPNSSVSKPPPA